MIFCISLLMIIDPAHQNIYNIQLIKHKIWSNLIFSKFSCAQPLPYLAMWASHLPRACYALSLLWPLIGGTLQAKHFCSKIFSHHGIWTPDLYSTWSLVKILRAVVRTRGICQDTAKACHTSVLTGQVESSLRCDFESWFCLGMNLGTIPWSKKGFAIFLDIMS